MSDSEKIPHGPKGAIGGVASIREYATLDGQPIGSGDTLKTSLMLPPWFTRTGRVLYKIDSGFGDVLCRAVTGSDEDFLKILNGDKDAPFSIVVDALVALPSDWKIEEPCQIGSVVFKKGDDLPPIRDIRDNESAAQAYVQGALPPSLIAQVVTGQRYVSLPPIPASQASPR